MGEWLPDAISRSGIEVAAWLVCPPCLISWAWPNYTHEICPECGQPVRLQDGPLGSP